ncbi:MAG: tRNA (5-methylaminomethyl-2-thiouridine)(34)-methyltransferase MnmD [Bacteroidetes bacterium]|nr:tRNA (5-methylaminomethyl-2-thiouridine)(34)-methyltransferase MnmD [Bacteroidota bacterium]
MNEHYHSSKGALSESLHVFIENGLRRFERSTELTILEVGMGTGLNALLTAAFAHQPIMYIGLEPYPLEEHEWTKLHFPGHTIPADWITQLHKTPAGTSITLNHTSIVWHQMKLEAYQADRSIDLVYFDAFAPMKQAGPWCMDNLQKIYDFLAPNGLLTTYCANGQFKRNLRSLGFELESPPGPMGKREITLATKI